MAGGSGIIVSGARGIYEWSAPIDYGSVVFHGAGLFPQAGTFYHDASARKNNGTLVNGPTWQWVPELGRSGTNHAATQQASIPNSLAGLPGMTMAFWTFPTLMTWNTQTVFASRASDTSNFGLFGSSVNGEMLIRCSDGENTYGYGGALALSAAWWHVALVFDGTQATNATRLKCYTNGILRAATFGGTVPTALPNTGQPVLLSSSGTYYARYADSLITNTALSPPQIAWLANRGNNPWQPWRRKWWPVVSAPATTKIPVFMNHYRNLRVSA